MSCNKLFKSMLLTIISLAFVSCSNASVETSQSQKAQPIKQDQRMKWWRDAKFGMFIHWGVYSVPAGEWNGTVRKDKPSEWIMAYADIPIDQYETLAPKFNPEKFDAAEWVNIAKQAGMKYMVITAKHHDGFAMYDSKVSDYDIVDSTPYGKDVIAELSRECKKAGIKFCTYYSILDWHHPSQEPTRVGLDADADTFDIYGNNTMKEGQKEEYRKFMMAQLNEIITQYDPEVLWFDGGWVKWWNHQDGRDLQKYIRDLKPTIIHNNRIGIDEDLNEDYGTPEGYIPDGGLDYDWETCMTMNESWGYKRSDSNWKSTKLLIFNIIDIASKGGNYLLNVGPSEEGLIPQPSIERLKQIGNWLEVNGQAIYGTTAWSKRKEGPTDITLLSLYETQYDTSEDEKISEPVYTAEDIVFTSKGDTLYAICLAWPKEKVLIKSLGTKTLPDIKILSVSMLGVEENLKWQLSEEGLIISAPKQKPCDYAFVFKIDLDK